MKKVILLGGSAIIIGSATASPYWFGSQIEGQFRTEIQQLKSDTNIPPWIKVHLDSYEKGWLSSTARTTLTIDLAELAPPNTQQQPPEAIDIVVDHNIKHGPLAGSQLGMGMIESTLVVPAEAKDVVAHYFGNRSPFQQTTYVGMDGHTSTQFQIPAYHGRDHTDKMDINWQGLTGTFEGNWQSREGSGTMQAPLLEISSDDGNIAFKSLKLEGSSHYTPEGLNLGNGNASLAEIIFSSPTEPGAHITGFKIAVDSDQNGSLVSGGETFSFEKAEIAQQLTIGPGELALEVRNLDAKTMATLNDRLYEAQKNGATPDQAGAAFALAMMELGPELLKSSPEFELRKLNLTTEMGDITSSLLVSFDGKGDFNLQDLSTLIPKLTIEAKASVPAVLLQMASQTQVRAQVAAMMEQQDEPLDPEELEMQIQQATQQQLAQLEQMNFIVPKDNLYTSHLLFKEGQLTLNGQPANQLLGALPIPQQEQAF
jgi:uncharacterized protein YdgA (DUF945 family)